MPTQYRPTEIPDINILSIVRQMDALIKPFKIIFSKKLANFALLLEMFNDKKVTFGQNNGS